jgi:DNA (cytosine-5)-methyltransferase 1
VLTFGSVCSGIEAASVAWEPLGWHAAWFAEIDPFASAVLAHRWPGVENRGDFTRIESESPGSIDVLVGGTPCQSFSIAGRRLGLDDPRGNLAIEFLRLARRLRPLWLVFENVPGFLSSGGGRDFGAFLGLLGQLGYRGAYRVLDAQYFGVPQRRRRVFVVGHLGDWRRAAAVLFERSCLSGDSPPRREAAKNVAGSLGGGTGERGWCDDFDRAGAFVPETGYALNASENGRASHNQGWNTNLLAFSSHGHGQFREGLGIVTSRDGKDGYLSGLVTHSLRADGFDASEDGTGRGTPLVPVAFNIIGLGQEGRNHAYPANVSGCLQHKGLAASGNEAGTLMVQRSAVRRLTPREAERLQGFPDDWTLVPYRGKPASDGPRYRALGNSFAVPVMRWIGQRIQMVNDLVINVA